MLDPQLLRHQIDLVAEKLSIRGFQLDTAEIINLEAMRKQLQTETEDLQSQRNQFSKAIGLAKSKKEDTTEMMLSMQGINAQLIEKEKALEGLQTRLKNIYLNIPNLPHESVPRGRSDADNVEMHRVGSPKAFSFTPKDHTDLGAQLGLLDFDLGAKITGARFCVMRNDLVRLHRALIHFMIDMHTREHGYQEIYVPYIVNQETLVGTGQLPKLSEDLFKLTGEPAYYLIPTAEVPVTNTVRDSILNATDLPLRYVCHTPCFRSEAGSYGKDTRGMIRQHQFEKVELIWISTPDESYQALESLLSHAENILKRLELPYRVVALCGGDLGFGSAKTYDIEVWLPGQNQYREISSCSNCEAFQARRLQARYKNTQTGKNELVHTLNGSGLAIGRTLLAIMENYQDEAGNIHIPTALQPYMHQQIKIGT